MSTLAAQAIDLDQANFRLGNEAFEMARATFVRNTSTPNIYDSNHAGSITARTPEAIDALLAAAEREFAQSQHRRFLTDFRTPPEFVARLLLDGGYQRRDALVMVLEGALVGDAPACDIRPLASNADWEAMWPVTLQDWNEYHEKVKRPTDETMARQMLDSKRSKQPPVQYWLAYVQDTPVGYFNSWHGVGGMGQVEDLFVSPPYRKRGIATALVHHCVADARAKGAGPVVIVADPTDTPKNIYARMGFRAVATAATYHRDLPKGA
jgi:predicted N-acetyltransferase YhbS